MKFSIISLLISTILLSGCYNYNVFDSISYNEDCIFANIGCNGQLKNNEEKVVFYTKIHSKQLSLTGVTIVKRIDNKIFGSIINEFGFKVFDFIISDKQCDIVNTSSMIVKSNSLLNTLKQDIYFLANNKNIESNPLYDSGFEESYWVVNKRKRILYMFKIVDTN